MRIITVFSLLILSGCTQLEKQNEDELPKLEKVIREFIQSNQQSIRLYADFVFEADTLNGPKIFSKERTVIGMWEIVPQGEFLKAKVKKIYRGGGNWDEDFLELKIIKVDEEYKIIDWKCGNASGKQL